MNLEELFWDQVFASACRTINGESVTQGMAKEAAKVADIALKARRKTFKAEPVTA